MKFTFKFTKIRAGFGRGKPFFGAPNGGKKKNKYPISKRLREKIKNSAAATLNLKDGRNANDVYKIDSCLIFIFSEAGKFKSLYRSTFPPPPTPQTSAARGKCPQNLPSNPDLYNGILLRSYARNLKREILYTRVRHRTLLSAIVFEVYRGIIGGMTYLFVY